MVFRYLPVLEISVLLLILLLSACGGGGGSSSAQTPTPVASNPPTPVAAAPVTQQPTALDTQLLALNDVAALNGNAFVNRTTPSIESPMATLGKFLFFSTHLGGQDDTACVSCHHPMLGGGDNLSLPVGVSPVDAANLSDIALLGLGRHSVSAGNMPIVPRNAPTTFNIGVWDRGLFWDSRIESDGNDRFAAGTASTISTPDGASDSTLPTGTSLVAAQARFPVTSSAEMRGDFLATSDNQTLRQALADKMIASSGDWASLFTAAFGDEAITFDRIAAAIAAYETSMVFANHPFSRYIQGDLTALTTEQKEGAILFYTREQDGGGGCSRCHSGDRFTDERHHVIGFPQLTDDRGREAISNDNQDRHHFRTPTLLNVAQTAPYGHSGLFQSLEEVVRHYDNPRRSIDDLFGEQNGQPFQRANPPICQLPQIERAIESSSQTCEGLLSDGFAASQLALQSLQANDVRNPLGRTPNLNQQEVSQLTAFLGSLSDPCITDRDCMDPWIVDTDDLTAFPDNSALIAHDEQKLDL